MQVEKWKKRLDEWGKALYGSDTKVIKNILILSFAGLFCLFAYLGILNRWKGFWYYPEAEYQIIEQEAIGMIENKNFDANVEYNIQYHNKKNELELILLPDNPVLKTTAKVTDYGKDIQTITIERKFKNKFLFRLYWIGILITISIMIALVIYLLLPIIVLIVLIILLSIYETIVKICKKNKTHKK